MSWISAGNTNIIIIDIKIDHRNSDSIVNFKLIALFVGYQWSIWTMLLRLSLPGGGFYFLYGFVRRRVRAAAAPRMDTASHPCHPDIYKTAFSIHLVFNILDTSINTQAASTFQKVRENIRVIAAIFNLFSSN